MTSDDAPSRPAPLYGEYATPEEQQERIRLSGGSVEDSASGSLEPAPALSRTELSAPATVPAPHVPSTDPAPLAPSATAPAASEERPVRRGDRIVTIGLLVYGLVTVLTTMPQLIDYAGFAQTWFDMAGVDAEFTAVESGRLWGTIAAVLFALGWVLTAALSWVSLAARRVSWWIPIAGAVVTFLIVSLCLSAPLLSDPALIEQVLRAG